MTRVAALDLGSNSTRLLIADVQDGVVAEVDRRTRVTRMAHAVDVSGRLDPEAVERVLAAVDDYADVCADAGAARRRAHLTAAARDAVDGDGLAAEVARRLGGEARVIGADEEALLTFRGATSERRAADGPVAVVDVGGGSTELVVGERDAVRWHVSLPLGVVRQSERHLHHDPPTPAQLGALRAEARSLLRDAVAPERRGDARTAVAVGGTPLTLAAMDRTVEEAVTPAAVDAGAAGRAVHGLAVATARADALGLALAAMPEAKRRRVPGLHPDRAPTIVAGAILLVEAVRVLGLDVFEASDHDLLRGAALELAQQ